MGIPLGHCLSPRTSYFSSFIASTPDASVDQVTSIAVRAVRDNTPPTKERSQALATVRGAMAEANQQVVTESATIPVANTEAAEQGNAQSAPVTFNQSGDSYTYAGPQAQALAKALGLTATEQGGMSQVSVPRHKLFDAEDALEAAGIEATFDNDAPAAPAQDAAALKADRRSSDWPDAVDGWRVVGGSKKVPGYASESAAKIAIRQNRDWSERGATVLPFSYNDGSLTGPYRTTETRYAVVVREAEAPTAAAPVAEDSSVAAQVGKFGPIFTQFRHDAQGAIEHLRQQQTGEAIAALHHPDVGDIDLVWGAEGTGKSDGMGLAKLVAYHPEVLDDLQGFLSGLKKDNERSGPNRVRLSSPTGFASVRLDWDGEAKAWLMTAFERGVATGTRTDIAGDGVADDTARRNNDSSESVAPTPTTAKPAATAAPKTKASKKAAADAAARAEYFTPGNVLKGYSGHDRVLEYNPNTEGGGWAVKVQKVRKEGDAWVDVPNEPARWHSTQPEARELKAGPVVKAEAAPVAEAVHIDKETGAAEPATPQAISESVTDARLNSAKFATNAEVKAWLKERIKEALPNAGTEKGQFVTFDVPGDGKFKVENTREGLTRFLGQVEKLPGNNAGKAKVSNEGAKQYVTGSNAREAARQMIEQRKTEPTAYMDALELLEAAGETVLFLPNTDGAPFLAVKVEDVGDGLSLINVVDDALLHPQKEKSAEASTAPATNSARVTKKRSESKPPRLKPQPAWQVAATEFGLRVVEGKTQADAIKALTSDIRAKVPDALARAAESGAKGQAQLRAEFIDAYQWQEAQPSLLADEASNTSESASDDASSSDAAQAETPAATTAPTPAQQTAKPEAWGEKVGGAARDRLSKDRAALSRELGDDPSKWKLSEAMPELNYSKLAEDGVPVNNLFAYKAMRDSLPTRPAGRRRRFELRRWGAWVQYVRDAGLSLLEGRVDADAIMSTHSDSHPAVARFRLYQALGIELMHKAKGVAIEPGVTAFMATKDGSRTSERGMAVSVNGQRLRHGESRVFQSWDAAVDAIRQALQKEDSSPKRTGPELGVSAYKRDSKNHLIYMKKGGKLRVLKDGFASKAEAQAYLEANREQLEALVKEAGQLRDVRGASDRDRVGRDRTAEKAALGDGKGIDPGKFGQKFGFRSVDFGDSMPYGERSAHLDRAHDALMDLAELMNVPPQALGLNGKLAIAFGSRGRGGKNSAAAHYEPDGVVINLTRNKGAGSLAHEWFHALDNYFARQVGGIKAAGSFATEYGSKSLAGLGIRPEVADAFVGIIKATEQSGMATRAEKLDSYRGAPYWGTKIEMAARAFEAWAVHELEANQQHNDYLANLGGSASGSDVLAALLADAWPYPTLEEMQGVGDSEGKGIVAAVNALATSLKTETVTQADGSTTTRLFSKRNRFAAPATTAVTGMARPQAELAIAQFLKAYQGAANIRVNIVNKQGDVNGLPSKADEVVRAFYENGEVTIVLENIKDSAQLASILRHEVLAHHGLRSVVSEADFQAIIQAVLNSEKATGPLAEVWRTVRSNYTGESDAVLAEEVIAHIGEETDQSGLGLYWDRVVGLITRALRAVGLLPKGEISRTEIRNLIRAIGEGMKQRNSGTTTANQAGQASKEAGSFAQTERAYGGQDAYNRAQAAGKTKLNYHQWVQVRTPEFKAWFGDWENDNRQSERVGQGNKPDVGRVDGERTNRPEQAGTAAATEIAGGREVGSGDRRIPDVLIDLDTGEPRVFYHGTRDDITAFDLNHPNRKDNGWLGRGVYVASDARLANFYADQKGGNGGQNVMPLFVRSTEKIYAATVKQKQVGSRLTQQLIDQATNIMRQRGHDGASLTFGDGTIELVTFEPGNVKSATGNNGDFNASNPDIRYSRSPTTQQVYEQRIDALFAGENATRQGVKILDRSDVLDVLGFGDKPLHLQESAVGKLDKNTGKVKHPGMTAQMWKRVPEWIDNPVAVFRSQTVPDALVMFAPELVNGRPVRITIEPSKGMAGLDVHVTTNAYEESGSGVTPVDKWASDAKALLYLDQKESPAFGARSGLRLPRDVRQLKGYKQKVQTETDLAKYREAQSDQSSNSSDRRYSRARASALKGKGEKIRDWIAGKWDDLTPAMLGALTLRHLADIGGKLLPGIKDYLDTVHQMSAARNERADAAGKFAKAVQEWARKNKAMANRLFDLMHSATIAGVDPSLPFVRLDMRQAGQAMDRYRDQLSKATCRRNQ